MAAAHPKFDIPAGAQDSPPRRQKRLWSIRALLIGLVLGCLLPGILGTVALFSFEYQRRNAQLQSDTIATARALVQTVDAQLLKAQSTALALSASPYLATNNFPAFHQQARELLEKMDFGDFITLVDETGRFVLHTQQPFGKPLARPANPEQIRQVFSTGRIAVSGVFPGAVTRSPIISIYVPVVHGGKVVYSLGLVILAERFSQILAAQRFPSDWVANIVDGAGAIAARTHSPEEFVGQKAAPALMQRLKETPEGTVRTETLEGIPIVFSYSRSPVSGWGVVIGIPRQGLENDLMRSLLSLGLGIAGLFGLGIGLAWLISNRIAGSVQALISPALSLGAGKSVNVPKVAIKEVAAVANSIGTADQLLKQRTQALQESERHLALALEAGGSVVSETEVDSGVVRGVELFGAMLGYQPGELTTAADWIALVHEDDRVGLSRALGELIGGQRDRYRAELRLRAKNDTWHWMLFQAVTAECDAQGRVIRVISTHTDISERKAVEAEIQRLNAELEQRIQERTSELEQSNNALMHTNMELQHFAHATAHDLQTPLRSVAGFAQLLQRDVEAGSYEQVKNWASLVVDNTKRLQTLIQELLKYSRLNTQGLPFAAVDLRGVANEVIASMAVLIKETGAEVSCGYLPTLLVGRIQITQVLQSLIENGIKYNDSKPPRISITSEFQEDQWVFSVADNGIGIDPRHHERIFEIFRRLHTYDRIPGTGIGLALCRRIVERHGGHIWVESRPGEGSIFYFTLPVRPLSN